jgi:putative ABC transport system substrate-binding protein
VTAPIQRRSFLTLLGGVAAAWPIMARAQQVRRVGVLMSAGQEDDLGATAEVTALRTGLSDLGWIEGRNIQIDFRWPGSDLDRAQRLAKELVALRPDVLIGRSTPTTAALKRESSTIPIIFVNVTEPVQQGFVQSLPRPGGNITGFSNFEASIGGKWLQLLKEVAPRTTRVAIIYNPQTAPFAGLFLSSVQSAAPRVAVETVALPIQNNSDIETALTRFARQPGAGLIAIPDSFTGEHRDLIIATAARNRLPALYANLVSAPSGGLMAYSVDTRDLMQRAATYVDRILKGTNPGDLPVQQPAKFQLVINLKTAKALGLEVPATLLATADEVIE